MDDLAAWLLACIAEDEEVGREMLRQLDDADENMDGGWSLWGNFGRLADRIAQPKRWMAECDAKRHLLVCAWEVAALEDSTAWEYGRDPVFHESQRMLKVMALPYADRRSLGSTTRGRRPRRRRGSQ